MTCVGMVVISCPTSYHHMQYNSSCLLGFVCASDEGQGILAEMSSIIIKFSLKRIHNILALGLMIINNDGCCGKLNTCRYYVSAWFIRSPILSINVHTCTCETLLYTWCTDWCDGRTGRAPLQNHTAHTDSPYQSTAVCTR